MKKIFPSLLLAIVFLSLSSAIWVDLQLLFPAYLDVPAHIQKVVIVDRTKGISGAIDVIEGTLSGEGLGQDAEVARSLMSGIQRLCQQTDRLEVVLEAQRYIKGNVLEGGFSNPLSWGEVQELCRQHEADALLVIEDLDSDIKAPKILENSESSSNIKAKLKVKMRFYDAEKQNIFDEFSFYRSVSWKAENISLESLLQDSPNKRTAFKNAGFNAGIYYGKRVSPYYLKKRRYFFNKPKKDKLLVLGARKTEVSDWKGAIKDWEKSIKQGGKKSRPERAAHNIAVAYEVLGDIDKAKEWASRAYAEFGEKDAKSYYDALQSRLINEKRAQKQLALKKKP